ncbi:DUF262 domain-containing protein [Amycolatopsis cihanbeyliensis]|uniref:Uncharacterized protein with ParB-like and HNH nuclease domain n=1 Tax=Amycolatopsis cihanbeyliensis TaxID=1128664 RepID=A0A542DM86_AMYCI|nr:DUF262 domain-containing protein [Amycolatopsis cihanbeyliensis]TQJ04094.1 uncharacterized protein with ParB-like and HNH nuclease domain [Amycolatopsis cihanbeyliensis]
MKQLEAHEVPLHKIFCSDYDFQIPEYQRPYAWETEQTLQLLDDLIEALDRNRDEPYFLGSIVLVKDPDAPAAQVIDGQQRLTTLTILYAVLRDLTRDEEFAKELDEMICEPGKKSRGLQRKPRLALRSRDTEFFHKYVQTSLGTRELAKVPANAMSTEAQEAIQANSGVLSDKLGGWHENRRLELIRMLSDRTYLVVVSTSDLNSAHRIFSVMNDRGLDLSPADIFKSTIIGNLTNGQSANYSKKWEDAEEALGREDFADLFLHIRMIFAKDRAKRELLKEFPEQVLDSYLPNRADHFVDDVLVPYADAYEKIRDLAYVAPEDPDAAERVNAWFKRLSQLDNNDWRAPALWALRHHGGEPEWLDRFFQSLERLAASMFIRRVYTSLRANRYAELLRGLDAGHGLSAGAFRLSEDEQAETLKQLDGPLYLVTKVRKYVLLRVDEVLAKDSGATYKHPIITVEHVLPQNPKPNSTWMNEFSDNEHRQWRHRIANLVLLNRRKNSEAQNYDFAMKKEKYFTGKNGVSNFALTTGVLSHQEWTSDVLERRQQELTTLLREEWQLE